MKKIDLIIILFLLVICCKSEEKLIKSEYIVKGQYINNNLYQVTSYGFAAKNIDNKIESRNMAKEAAILLAQKKVQDEFKIPENIVIKSGNIEKTEFINDKICKIIYVVDINYLKELKMQNQ